MPRVCSVILVASRELDLTSDQYLGDELMFNMLLLSEMLCVPGKLDIFYNEAITFHKYVLFTFIEQICVFRMSPGSLCGEGGAGAD